MTTGEALLAAVLADPEDDAPRLIYADWLDERGDCDRAEFIRVQCELGQGEPRNRIGRRQGYGPRADRFVALLNRQVELLYAAARSIPGDVPFVAWLEAPALNASIHGHGHLYFRRGFAQAAQCSAGRWLAHGDAILAAQPVEGVTLTTRPELPDARPGFGPNFGLLVAVAGREVEVCHPARVRSDEWLRTALSRRWGRVKEWRLPGPTHGAPWQLVMNTAWGRV